MFWVENQMTINVNDIVHTLTLTLHTQFLFSLLPQPVELLVALFTNLYISIYIRVCTRAHILGIVLYTLAHRSYMQTYLRFCAHALAIRYTVIRSYRPSGLLMKFHHLMKLMCRMLQCLRQRRHWCIPCGAAATVGEHDSRAWMLPRNVF